ncbi:slipin family protein [Ornithinimicrobium sp. Y1847]|uniref:slipin family protein n=1 Tax=unclassified Ornithinimicrobium TaxID=2615080 RepID=UPI003B67F73B
MIFRQQVAAATVALLYRRGIYERTLEPGRHRVPWGSDFVRVDVRERLLQVAPQEILTEDGLSVRVSTVLRVVVNDPRAYHERAADPEAMVYLAAQVALREALGSMTVEELTQRGAQLPIADLTAAVAEVGHGVGLEVREVVVKDVILPAELRAATVEVATAKARGLARLEAARAETAALRSMANGAKLLADNPALAQLRMVESLPYGSQLVLRVGDTTGADARADGTTGVDAMPHGTPDD